MGKIGSIILQIEEENMHIESFRLFSSAHSTECSVLPEEQRATKGLGKVMLCYAVRMCRKIFKKKLNPLSKLEISLNAMATAWHDASELQHMMRTCKTLTAEEIINDLCSFHRCDGVDRTKIIRTRDLSELKLLYILALQNRFLVKYYQQTYGFEPLARRLTTDSFLAASTHNQTQMIGRAKTILEHCQVSTKKMKPYSVLRPYDYLHEHLVDQFVPIPLSQFSKSRSRIRSKSCQSCASK
jgi:hypothetical protein